MGWVVAVGLLEKAEAVRREMEKKEEERENSSFYHIKVKKDDLMYEINFIKYKESITGFMGKLPPDLSMYYMSRGTHFLETIIEDPQSQLPGTAMPRVGVTAESMEKVIEFLEDSGDAKRHKREEVGKNVMIYIVIFALFAILWKKQVWRDLH